MYASEYLVLLLFWPHNCFLSSSPERSGMTGWKNHAHGEFVGTVASGSAWCLACVFGSFYVAQCVTKDPKQ